MQLTQYTDIGLRLLMLLAAADTVDGVGWTTRDAADRLAVSYPHAAKVVRQLQTLGAVQTHRGRRGGLVITDLGRTVSVGWLVRRLEGDEEVVDCEGNTPCPLRGGCRLRNALFHAREAFFAVLDPLTVADLTVPPTGSILLTLAEPEARA